MIWALLFAFAQDVPIDCEKDQTQVAMNACSYRDFKSADAALNAQWKVTYGEMKAADAENAKDRSAGDKSRPGAVALLDAQRAWLKYRDAQCEAEGDRYRGGSMQPMVVSGCKTGLTTARIAELMALIEEN